MKTTIRGFVLAGLTAALMGVGFATPAAADAAGAIKYRQSVMKAVGGHMGAMNAILKGLVPHTDDLAGHAHAMAELSKISSKVFPKGSGAGKTRTKAEVWDRPDDFTKAVAAFQAAAADLAKTATSNPKAAGSKFQALGKSCKGCHDTFRAKKK